MRRRAALLWIVLALLVADVHTAAADTTASCSTNTATSYCVSIDSGVQASAAASGFVLIETVTGVLIGLLFGWYVLRKVFRAAGLIDGD